jgi:hypothetical protein
MMPEDFDLFFSDMKWLNWASHLERCVKVVQQYILRDDLGTFSKATKCYKV